REAGRHLAEMQFSRRSGDHRRPIRREPSRGADRHCRAGHLLSPARAERPFGQYPCQIDRRAFSRTHPHLRLRQWSRPAEPEGARLHLVSRSDAAQPRPPGRGAPADPESHRAPAGARPDHARKSSRQSAELEAITIGSERADCAGPRRGSVQRPQIFHDQPEPFRPRPVTQDLQPQITDEAWTAFL
ncbi:MAG: Polyphosphate kinase, partial [uncultured Microvirga sp.]